MIRSSFFRPMAFCRSFATPAIRDPARPALPLNAYIRFADAYRKEKSLKGGKESLKLIGSAWRALPAEKRTPFETACQADREKYTVALQKYKDSGALDAWKRDPDRPKAPLCGYFRYLASFRASDKAKGLKAKDVLREGAKGWKSMDSVQKKALDDAFAKERVPYIKALEQYKASGKEVAWKKKVGIWDKEQKVLMKKGEEKEKKRKVAEKARNSKLKLKEKISLLREKQKLKLKKTMELQKQKELRAKENERKKKSLVGKTVGSKSATRGAVDKERLKIINEIAKERLDALTRKLTKESPRKTLAASVTRSSKTNLLTQTAGNESTKSSLRK